MLRLREDLEPWNCDKCEKPIYICETLNLKSYCHDCFDGMEGVEIESEDEENPEVNLSSEL